MSSFGMNESMRHFVSLPSTARYYAAVMDIATASLPALETRVHRVRYEDLIANPRGEQRQLCEFLGLDWREEVLRPDARTRGERINTPSYYQVTQPLYGRAIGRWRHYRVHLTPVLPALRPFVERWGYPPD